jgi:putative membrane protein
LKLRIAGLTSLIATSFLSLPAGADPGDPSHGIHMWGGGWHEGAHGPLMMMAGFILLLAILVAFVFVIVRATGRSGQTSGDVPTLRNPALAVLRERFARGEIDAEEFEQRRRVLDA